MKVDGHIFCLVVMMFENGRCTHQPCVFGATGGQQGDVVVDVLQVAHKPT